MKGLRLGLGMRGWVASSMAEARGLVEANGSDVSILVIGDSTSVNTFGWPRLFGDWLGTQYPTHSVEHTLWNDTTTSYPVPTTLATGSGANTITIYNASISGTRPVYLMGSRFAAAIGNLNPDLIIWNHGQNVYGGLTDGHYRGEFFSAFEQVRSAHPTVPTAIVLQNPRRDDDNMAQVIASLRDVVQYYGTAIDVYSEYMAQGKAASLYSDNLHPSTTGNVVYRDKVIQAWWRSGSLPAVAPAQTSATSQNLLTNGDFSTWTGAVPSDWQSSSSAVTTKELVIVDGASPYSCKVTGTSASAGIAQTISGASATALAGAQVFLSVRMYVPSGQANTVGLIYLRYTAGGSTTYVISRGVSYGKDGFCWQMIGPVTLPANTTEVRVFLYCDSAANAGSVVYYDRAVLVQGAVPRDMA